MHVMKWHEHNVYEVNLNFVELQARNPNADLTRYFDVIGGISTDGLITAMLAAPSHQDPNRGAFTTAQIIDFYKQNDPHIFNESSYNNNINNILRTSSILTIDSNE
ncbi:hypothetical protein V8G54_034270 [Vigna mungo]|uniref:Uncharacterized protein n=1 Tax=Vigna mungo TaxID=3915 RepID=A0AAQ3MQ56_VIGMU